MHPTIKASPKSTYDVSIENQPDGTYKATVLSLPDCHTSGNTEQEAIEKISQILKNRLATSKIVTLEIDNPQTENPWLKLAGKYKNDPQLEEMLKGIEAQDEILSYQSQVDSLEDDPRFEQILKDMAAQSKIILLNESRVDSLEIEPHPAEHPWMEFAGMYKDNPLFEEVASYIESERNKIDREND